MTDEGQRSQWIAERVNEKVSPKWTPIDRNSVTLPGLKLRDEAARCAERPHISQRHKQRKERPMPRAKERDGVYYRKDGGSWWVSYKDAGGCRQREAVVAHTRPQAVAARGPHAEGRT